MRWNIGRNSYLVPPGLYAIGQPAALSPVLVTANYKLTYDRVRSNLKGRDIWLLVLETYGINVWCAAGKGTFGHHELIRRIKETDLKNLVSHRTLLLPILGAPGVAAHVVRQESGFNVRYAVIRATDLAEFLDNGMLTTPAMQELSFNLWERLVLTPVELVQSLRCVVPVVVLVTFAGWILNSTANAITVSLTILLSLLCGTVLVPALLPWLPGRYFALQGAIAGLLCNGGYLLWQGDSLDGSGWLATLLLGTAVSSFFALNFTGSTPYTSRSGVHKEMKLAIPALLVTLLLAALFGTMSFFS